jgi:indolepyruvate ferredoxin oxidoreductase
MDERFFKEEGADVFTGNELIVKGALENAVALITGYPGSPVSDIFDVAYAHRDLLKKHGVLAEMANNEALSVARLNGSRMAGVRAMAVMKSVGLHVAADGLALGNLSEPHNAGGSIVVVGDDPWIDSTQINNDSRYLSQHLHMPVIEPATFQEIKDWVGYAFELSSLANLYMTYLVTTPQADGGGTVWVHPNRYPDVNTLKPVTLETQNFDLDTTVLLPPRTWAREATLPQRFEKLLQEVRLRRMNHIRPSSFGDKRAPIGFVASGLSYCYLEHALTEMGLAGKYPILKLGVSYPVDPEVVLSFAQRAESLYVIEEKRGFIETQIVQILHDARQAGSAVIEGVSVWGKKFPHGRAGIPVERGLNASLITQYLLPLLLSEGLFLSDAEQARLRREQLLLEATAQSSGALPLRTPTFCPGCPHRDSSSVFLELKKDFLDRAYMKRVHQREPVDLLFHGETGCFTMLMFEPNKPLMHNYSGMGLGGGTGAGLDPFVTNKQVVFLGDSTFFHSGMVAISDSIKSGQDITYVILDNKTTAMTGHQPTPGTAMNLMGEKTFTQSIEDIVRGMTAQHMPVERVNPEYRESYRQLLEDTVLQDGVKIIIADKECGITYNRRLRQEQQKQWRRQGFIAEEHKVNITPEVCEFCLECTKNTGCPGLAIEETLYGPKIVTDMTHCVSDGACTKVKACPSFENVRIYRNQAPAGAVALPPFDDLPLPTLPKIEGTWNGYVAGVGGMGAGLISAVLVQAAQHEGLRVLFSDKKGLAIRNGGVFGHILLSSGGGVLAPLVPYGKADLLIGIDQLEAARGLDPAYAMRVAHPERTRAVINTATNPTVRMLLGQDALPGTAVEEAIRSRVRPEEYWGHDVSIVSDHYFGSKLYANMVLLGVAWQKGYVPLPLGALEKGIRQAVSKENRQMNLDAFQIGRVLAWHPERVQGPQKIHTYRSLVDEKTRLLEKQTTSRIAALYREKVEEAIFELDMDDLAHQHLALRVYDLILYENLTLAESYLKRILDVARKDREEWNFEATRAVIVNAFKVTAIKDEVYVAHLLTSPEKRARDNARFHIDESRGDRLEYRHINRPEFILWGRSIRWDMETRDWQLRLMRRMKFLRRWLPGWHRDEREFRDWYLSLVDQFDAESETAYRLWVTILKVPEEVRGFREVRQPLMEEAKKKAAAWLRALRSAPEKGALPRVQKWQPGEGAR